MMVSELHRRREADRSQRHSKKATFLLPDDLLQSVDAAVAAGAAPSKNAFVERAIHQELVAVRRRLRRASLEKAVMDPLFLQDIADVERDFRFADAETISKND